jgi:DNA processing protein
LLAELVGPLDRSAHGYARLLDTLALPERELLAALGGRRRDELAARIAGLADRELDPSPYAAVCRHDPRYPRSLLGRSAPHALHLDGGGVERLRRLTTRPVVGILGARRASDHGMEVARGFARGLAASGVTVAATLADGIAAGAHAGVAEVGGGAIAVLADGPGAGVPVGRRALRSRASEVGCAVSELPGGRRARRFGVLAAERTVAALGSVLVLVESGDDDAVLELARLARARGRALAAVPGRVTSPLAAGPHALIREGATLAAGPEDVLELLPAARAGARGRREEPAPALDPQLAALRDRVAAGADTADRLCGSGADVEEVLLGLTRLELMGLLVRGAGGRYVVRSGVAGALRRR